MHNFRSLFFLLLGFFALMATAPGATVREAVLEIPTYELGPEDKNPPLWNWKAYPYPMQTEITRRKVPVRYRAVILENEYVQVVILPDLGGRIYAAHDKTNGDYDFIYRNHVIKPGLVALRGAWLSGGIEWNFPTRGHTVHTVSPVLYKTLENDDGSVTCVVGAMEWARRMKWSVFITVPSDRACFHNRIVVFNPTLTHNNAYWWTNAAVHAWPDTRVTFPPAAYTFAGMRRNPRAWPAFEGEDASWYKATPYPFDFFCGTPGDYQGAYNVQRDCGTVQCASRHDAFGKKFWTWGTARGGMIWEDLLTDEDGQYIEVQSGRLLTQGDTWRFDPHLTEQWDECWYPVKKLQGLVKANPDAAVNLDVRDGNLFAALNATREFRDARVEVYADGAMVFSQPVALGPTAPWQRDFPGAGRASRWRLVVRDSSGDEIIRCERPENVKIPPPELEPEFPPVETASAEEAYLAGYYALKHWDPVQAAGLFEAALEKDPGFTPALRELASLRYLDGRFQEALELAGKALRRNDDDDAARYYRALAKFRLGIDERTEEDLDLIGRRAAYRHVAPYVLAALAVRRNDLPRAESLLRQVIACNRQDVKSRVMLAAVLRLQQRESEARQLVDAVLSEDPLYYLATIEKALLDGKDGCASFDDPQYSIEAACDYAEMGLASSASAALAFAKEGHPLVALYRAYHRQTGEREAAQEDLRAGLDLSPDYVFPFRTEDETVLRAALEHRPNDWKLHHYLGTLLASKNRWQEGLSHLQTAEKQSPDHAVVYNNLGEIYLEKLQDRDKALAAYEKAVACDPNNYHYYVALDRLYAQAGEHAKRDALFERAPAAVKADFRVRLQRAHYLVDVEQFDDALALLQEHTFHPWEGWIAGRVAYLRVLHGRADKAMREGRYGNAVEDLRRAMEYPENLGVGKPHQPNYGCEYYKLGLCHKAQGKLERARDCFGKAVASPDEPSPGGADWHERAMRELREMAAP